MLLSFIAAFVDTWGFIGLFGLFSAHVTGNFVLIGAALVHPDGVGLVGARHASGQRASRHGVALAGRDAARARSRCPALAGPASSARRRRRTGDRHDHRGGHGPAERADADRIGADAPDYRDDGQRDAGDDRYGPAARWRA